MNWGFGSYSSLIARFEGLVQFISLKRTTIRNPATRSTAKLFTIRGRSRSKAGQIAFVPGSMNNFGPTIRTTTRTACPTKLVVCRLQAPMASEVGRTKRLTSDDLSYLQIERNSSGGPLSG